MNKYYSFKSIDRVIELYSIRQNGKKTLIKCYSLCFDKERRIEAHIGSYTT